MVNFKKIVALLSLILAAVSFAMVIKLTILDRTHSPSASLRIDSFPRTTIFLNDKQISPAPYLGEGLTPGEYKLKLVPTGGVNGTFVSWETKIKLTGGTLTYVSRNLGSTEELSGGQTLMLEKLALSDSKELAVVSNPDGASVTVDGQDEGKASIILHNLSVGDHDIVVSLPGHSDQVIHGRIIGGYRLNVIVKLGELPSGVENTASPSARSTADLVSTQSGQIAKPYVVIKETEVGFLRVRTDPNLNATEEARVKPGEKYALLSETSGWVKIKLPTLFGWVSDQYVVISR